MRLSFFCCKQKTAYEMRISDWSSDVCSSDLARLALREAGQARELHAALGVHVGGVLLGIGGARQDDVGAVRAGIAVVALVDDEGPLAGRAEAADIDLVGAQQVDRLDGAVLAAPVDALDVAPAVPRQEAEVERSEERRVGKEGVSTGRSRGSAD